SWLQFSTFRQPTGRACAYTAAQSTAEQEPHPRGTRTRRSLTVRIVPYWALLTALVYSHPLGLFMVAAHAVAYFLVRGALVLGFRAWLATQIGVLLAILPWYPRYLDHGTDYPLPRYSLRFLVAVPIEYVGGNGLVLLLCLLIIAFGMICFEEG